MMVVTWCGACLLCSTLLLLLLLSASAAAAAAPVFARSLLLLCFCCVARERSDFILRYFFVTMFSFAAFFARPLLNEIWTLCFFFSTRLFHFIPPFPENI